MKSEPLVSVVIPAYNRKVYVLEALKSVLSQTYKKIEIIIVDDGSTDGTDVMIKRSYPEIKYFWKENGGCGSALNYGIKKASGDFIAWLSSDDAYYDEKAIEKMLNVFERNKEVMMCYSDFYINFHNDSNFTTSAEKMRLYKAKEFPTKMERYMHNFKECLMNGSTTIYRKELFKAVGLFNECYKYCQDWDLWFRILYDYEVAHISEPLVMRNEHKGVQGMEVMNDSVGRELFEKEKMLVAKHQRLWLNKGNRPTICAELCIKDEEDMIEQCLDDIIQWADYVVIFDDGSTDRTPELIRRYPKVVDIYTQENKGNVRSEGKDRQKLLEMAQGTKADWIFFIDTDEICEMKFKWEIFDLINDPRYNLYHMREINLWRGLSHRRVDEMYNQGWFGRLFRNFPFLKMISDIDEHCCGIPWNIPGSPPWFSSVDSVKSKKIESEMIHYGFAYWDRTLKRYAERMERDPYRFDKVRAHWVGGALFYERMIDETILQLEDYPYVLKTGKIMNDYIERNGEEIDSLFFQK